MRVIPQFKVDFFEAREGFLKAKGASIDIEMGRRMIVVRVGSWAGLLRLETREVLRPLAAKPGHLPTVFLLEVRVE